MLSRSGRASSALGVLVLLAALLPAPVFAQFDTSTVLGSVSSALVHNAELPVLIVRGQRSVPGRTSEP